MMIRSKHLNAILKILSSNERFEVTDFDVEIGKSHTGGTTILIKYIPQREFVFKVTIPTHISEDGIGKYKFIGHSCPGIISFSESFVVYGIDIVYSSITNWLLHIWEELTADPIAREVEKQKQVIDKIFEKINNADDVNFDKKEIDDLRQRLTEVETNLRNELSKTVEDKDQLAKDLKELRNDFETLRQTLPNLKKTGWARGFITKIVKWTGKSENRTLLKEGYTLVKELLPENIGKSLPDLPEK